MSSPDLFSPIPEPKVLGKGWATGTAIYMAVVIGVAMGGYWLKAWSGQNAFNAAIMTIAITRLLFIGAESLRHPRPASRLAGLLTILGGLFFVAILLEALGVFAWPAWVTAYVIKPFAFAAFTGQWLFFAAVLAFMLPNPFSWLKPRRIDPAMGAD